MTLSQLEYALALREYGTFTRTSQKISITQPALSTQILKLEEEIGFTLFDRSTNPLQITRDGYHFLQRAEQIVAGSKDLLEFAQELRDDYEGNLKIGIIPTVSAFLVPLFGNEIQKAYPSLVLEISDMITEQVVKKVRSGELDAGIISTPIRGFGLTYSPLFYEKFYWYLTDDSIPPHKPEDVDTSELWLLEEGNCFRDQISDFCRLKKDHGRSLVYKCSSIDSLMRMVDHQGGTTILPELTTIGLSGEQEERIVQIGIKAREISLITRTNPGKKRFLDVLEEIIVANVPVHMRTDKGLEIVDPGLVFD